DQRCRPGPAHPADGRWQAGPMSDEEIGEGAEVAGEETGDESLWDKAVDWVKDKLGGDEDEAEAADEGSGYEGGGGESGGGGSTDEW
ncbi:MAG: hypothetical protein ACRD0U_12710, partial [Acidimicrobiales bacterium]